MGNWRGDFYPSSARLLVPISLMALSSAALAQQLQVQPYIWHPFMQRAILLLGERLEMYLLC